MKKSITIIAAAFCSLSFLLTGCNNAALSQASPLSPSLSISSDGAGKTGAAPEAVIHSLVCERCTYADAKEKEKWREPLIRLISAFHPNGEYVFAESGAADNEITYIPGGYYLSLFDIDQDGVPEVLESYGGGTFGNNLIRVYDLMIGGSLGYIDGGYDDFLCVYCCASDGRFVSVGQYSTKEGLTGIGRYIDKITIDRGGDTAVINAAPYLTASYTMEIIKTDPTAEEIAAGTAGAYEAFCRYADFCVNGDKSSIEAYFSEYDNFAEGYVRLPATGIKLIAWNDVSSRDDDIGTKSAKMAEALLSSGQEFITARE